LEKEFFEADKDGEVIFPLWKNFSGQGVLVSGDFAGIQSINI
jgi:hypothetical protein